MSGMWLPSSNIPRQSRWQRAFHAALCGVLLILLPGWASSTEHAGPPIRFGVTPAIVHDQYGVLDDWRIYLERKLQRKVEFVSRDSYRETIDLISQKKLDFAWVSTLPYVYLNRRHYASLLATPLYRGRPYYCAYFIVPATDKQTTSLLSLEGKVFAYADSYSNTGYLVPRSFLRQSGKDENRFFRKTFFTWSHRKVIVAVTEGLADGGSIDSFVWETLSVIHPELTNKTRIVAKSEEYGFPPIVVNASVSKQDITTMRSVLIDMSRDQDGIALLKRLNVDGFIPGDTKLYDKVAKLQRSFEKP